MSASESVTVVTDSVVIKGGSAFVLKHKLTGKDVRLLRGMQSTVDVLSMRMINSDPKDFEAINKALVEAQDKLDDWTYQKLSQCYEVPAETIENLEYPEILELFDRLRTGSTELPKNSSAPSPR